MRILRNLVFLLVIGFAGVGQGQQLQAAQDCELYIGGIDGCEGYDTTLGAPGCAGYCGAMSLCTAGTCEVQSEYCVWETGESAPWWCECLCWGK